MMYLSRPSAAYVLHSDGSCAGISAVMYNTVLCMNTYDVFSFAGPAAFAYLGEFEARAEN